MSRELRTTLPLGTGLEVRAGDICRSLTDDRWHGQIVTADFDTYTATFQRISRRRWWWLRVRNTWWAAKKAWGNVFQVLP